jgi:hypothetical protein
VASAKSDKNEAMQLLIESRQTPPVTPEDGRGGKGGGGGGGVRGWLGEGGGLEEGVDAEVAEVGHGPKP